MKILILGESKSGKTLAAQYLADYLKCTYSNTSDYIIDNYSAQYEIPKTEIINNKDKYREKLLKFGQEKQLNNHLWPQCEQIKTSDIITGLRNKYELDAAKQHNIYNIIIWINRPNIINHLDIGPEDADIAINNDGTEDQLMTKLIKSISQLSQ